jgi:hypothetical protein
MVFAGLAMLMLALAAIGMVLGSAGLEDEPEKHDRRSTGTGDASRGPAAVEDRRECARWCSTRWEKIQKRHDSGVG